MRTVTLSKVVVSKLGKLPKCCRCGRELQVGELIGTNTGRLIPNKGAKARNNFRRKFYCLKCFDALYYDSKIEVSDEELEED